MTLDKKLELMRTIGRLVPQIWANEELGDQLHGEALDLTNSYIEMLSPEDITTLIKLVKNS